MNFRRVCFRNRSCSNRVKQASNRARIRSVEERFDRCDAAGERVCKSAVSCNGHIASAIFDIFASGGTILCSSSIFRKTMKLCETQYGCRDAHGRHAIVNQVGPCERNSAMSSSISLPFWFVLKESDCFLAELRLRS